MGWFGRSTTRRQTRRSLRPEGRGHDQTRRYYVYLLYITLNDPGRMVLREVPLYAGKGGGGKGTRVEDHEKILRRKLVRGAKLDAKERLMLLAMDLGYQIEWRIIDRDLTEDEAFNLENAVIVEYGLLQRGNVAYPHRIVKVA